MTEGIDAIGEVLIRIESDGITYTGRGADTDIIVSSAKAYMNALNRLMAARKKAAEDERYARNGLLRLLLATVLGGGNRVPAGRSVKRPGCAPTCLSRWARR